jgi:hypothetical protein
MSIQQPVVEQELIEQLQRRVARLLLRHDRRAFRGRFRQLYTQSTQPQPELLRAYDQFIRLISLADELLDDILPRIRRQMSFSATRIELDEEPPLRGQIDWRRTIERNISERPKQTPLRFATTLRSRSFATAENRLLVAILTRYAQQLNAARNINFLNDEALNKSEHNELIQIEERLRRELATPQLQELSRDADPNNITDLIELVSRSLKGGVNPYADLINWWQRAERQHIKTFTTTQLSPVLQQQERAALLYQLWIPLELWNFLTERGQTLNLQIRADIMSFQYQWNEQQYQFVYDRSPKTDIAWHNAPGERPDYYITRLNRLKVEFEETIYWQEPGVILDAKYYLGDQGNRANSPMKRLLADMHLINAQHGALILPDTTGLKTSIYPKNERYQEHITPTSALELYELKPFESQDKLQHTLTTILDQVAAWLPARPEIACHACFPDPDTISAQGQRTTKTSHIFCPKPHISSQQIDLVNIDTDCLKNPKVCHIMGQESHKLLFPPFVDRILSLDELQAEIAKLRARFKANLDINDDSNEAEQQRNILIEAIGRLVTSYTNLHQADTKPIEDRLEMIFGSYWNDPENPRRLSEEVRHMLISGDFVHYEFSRSGVSDWAASSVQYVRAIEYELRKRLYLKLGNPSPLKDGTKVLKSHRFTFGTVSHALKNHAHPDVHNNPNAHNWSIFQTHCQTMNPNNPNITTEFKQAISEILQVHQLRNEIAHSSPINQDKASTVRSVTLGDTRNSQLSALYKFIKLLDT